MGKLTRRSVLAASAAVAVALGGAVGASANIDGSPIDIDGPPDVVTSGNPSIYRFAGPDRVSTALQAAMRTSIVATPSGWGDTVIIATSDDFADALAAGTLADVLDAPVLLNPTGNSLRSDVRAYVNANFDNVILVGGTGVFGDSVRTSLEAAGHDVERIGGPNRYQTALQLGLQTVARADAGTYDNVNVFLADGHNFPDALAAGAAAAENDGVVLLTIGWDRIDATTYGALTIGGLQDHESIIAVGGPAAAAAASGYQGDPIEVDHSVVGSNRYDTAVELADRFVGDAVNFVIASGENFPDGVVGGAYAGNVDGALLLTQQDRLTDVTGDYLESIRLEVENVFVFGGPGSVSPAVSRAIAELDWRY